MKRILVSFIVVFLLTACSDKSDTVLIYTNADDEAVAIIEKVLDAEGLEGGYMIQSMGTSELGGKLMAEGNKIEADVITMSSYFLESAQDEQNMFIELQGDKESLEDYGNYQLPILGNAGSIFVNTIALEELGLEYPKSLKDLTRSEYEGYISFPNIFDSSTGWLLIQAIIAEYGEKEGADLIAQLKANAGPHIESSGSGPIKKVKSGEVPIGFGLRNQAVQAQKEGLPIKVIDPIEGNYSLVESVSVVDKENNDRAVKVAKIIETKARELLLEEYPVSLYKGEEVSEEHQASFRTFDEKLTVKLLESHQEIFKQADGGDIN